MKKIFLSYSRKDLNFVENLADDLTKNGYDVWYDLSDLAAGDRWAHELENAICQSDIYVIVISPNSIKSEWVEKEFLLASRCGMKIVPLLYGHCELPLWLLNIHYVDVSGRNYKRNFTQVLEAFNNYGRREEDGPSGKKPKEKPIFLKKNMGWIIPVAVLIVIGIFAATFWPQAPTPPTPVPTVTSEPLPTSTPLPTATESPTPEPTVTLPPPETTEAPEIGPPEGMVLVSEGIFRMGCSATQSCNFPDNVVDLDAFYIDLYEVTNTQYEECELAQVCEAPTNLKFYSDTRYRNHPVTYIKWDMAKTYCEWLGKRLPTEAEWEKAASWDEKNRQKLDYPWGNIFIGNNLNFCDINCVEGRSDRAFNDGYDLTAPVGSFEEGRSPYGMYDMAGNVSEWVSDWYAVDYYENPPASNPLGPETGTFRVFRGGSWVDARDYVNTSQRFKLNPASNSYNYLGFRCAMDVNP